MKIRKFDSEEEWIDASVKKIVSVLEDGAKNVGLAGGSTPAPIYEEIGSMPLNWNEYKFILIDERFVPLNDPRSNFSMISARIRNADLIHFDTSLSVGESILKMRRNLDALRYGRDFLFDLLILGMGADGHIASLFPGEEITGDVLFAETDRFEVKTRVTLGMDVLTDCREAILPIKGEEKLNILKSDDLSLPVFKFIDKVKTTVFSL